MARVVDQSGIEPESHQRQMVGISRFELELKAPHATVLPGYTIFRKKVTPFNQRSRVLHALLGKSRLRVRVPPTNAPHAL